MLDILDAIGAVGDAVEAIDLLTRLLYGTVRLAGRLVRRVTG